MSTRWCLEAGDVLAGNIYDLGATAPTPCERKDGAAKLVYEVVKAVVEAASKSHYGLVWISSDKDSTIMTKSLLNHKMLEDVKVLGLIHNDLWELFYRKGPEQWEGQHMGKCYVAFEGLVVEVL